MSEELSVTCFEIITYVGTSTFLFYQCHTVCQKGEFEQAEQMIKQGCWFALASSQKTN